MIAIGCLDSAEKLPPAADVADNFLVCGDPGPAAERSRSGVLE
jgi:hypothetical protein